MVLYKDVELIAARAASYSPVMDAVAAKGLAKAKALASAHVETRSYISSLRVETVRTARGVLDREIVAEDPQVHIIEWGYLHSSGKWVPGQFIMTQVGRM